MKVKDWIEGPYGLLTLIITVIGATIAVLSYSARAADLERTDGKVEALQVNDAKQDATVEWLKKSVEWQNSSLYRLVQLHGISEQEVPRPPVPPSKP